ncbi:MAG: GNAT family N-acetyltransferase [Syntrophobacteraceae bacterium]|nr:GNAT family N-acetyltransferase [Syntrophobacteraceae bacterium]
MLDDEQQFSLWPVRAEYVSGLSMILCSMEPWLTMEYTPEAFEFYLLHADPALARHVVMIAGEVAGILSLRNPWLFGPLIELLALFDGFRNKGIGGTIVEWVGKRYKAENLWVTVASFNLAALRFYKRAGFEKTATLENLIKPGWNEVLLRKRVGQIDKS